MITHECRLISYAVDEWGIIGFNCEKTFLEDGVEIGRVPERYTVFPGQDVSNHEQYVQDVAAVVHTQAVIDAYVAYQAIYQPEA